MSVQKLPPAITNTNSNKEPRFRDDVSSSSVRFIRDVCLVLRHPAPRRIRLGAFRRLGLGDDDAPTSQNVPVVVETDAPTVRPDLQSQATDVRQVDVTLGTVVGDRTPAVRALRVLPPWRSNPLRSPSPEARRIRPGGI